MLRAGVEESFDRDVQAGHIGPRGWNLSSGASAMGRLGYKLMLQTGEVDNPVDIARVSYASGETIVYNMHQKLHRKTTNIRLP